MTSNTSTPDYSNEPQTAMLLTEQEWQDLAEIVRAYSDLTGWVRYRSRPSDDQSVAKILRKRRLADRISEAVL